jgi:hypothetical protein
MQKENMRAKGKKFVSLFFIFSLFSLSGNLVADEWSHGFTLTNQKTDSRQIMDKFMPVKRSSSLLLKAEFSIGAFNHNKDYYKIKFTDELKWVEKPNWRKFWKGAMYGALIGGGSLAIIGFMSGDDEPSGTLDIFALTAEQKALWGALIGGILGGLIGGLIAAL